MNAQGPLSICFLRSAASVLFKFSQSPRKKQIQDEFPYQDRQE